jgi:hypothetical protein
MHEVTSHHPPKTIRADITDVFKLELVVDTEKWNCCHSVWLDAEVGNRGQGQGTGTEGTTHSARELCLRQGNLCDGGRSSIADCLWRTRIWLPETLAEPNKKEIQGKDGLEFAAGSEGLRTAGAIAPVCIATVVSPGFSDLLDAMLISLRRFGRCDHEKVVVFAVDPDDECRRVIAKHGALMVECASSTPLSCAVKSVLYSAARVVNAEMYLCLDADTLVTGDLNPLFSALASLDGSVILATLDPYLMRFNRSLIECLVRFYGGNPAEFKYLLGARPTEAERRYPLIVNDGVFLARRSAMLALDRFIRSLSPRAANWLDSALDIGARNQVSASNHSSPTGLPLEGR